MVLRHNSFYDIVIEISRVFEHLMRDSFPDGIKRILKQFTDRCDWVWI